VLGVYTPDASYASKDQTRLAHLLEVEIAQHLANCQVEVAIIGAFKESDIPELVSVVKSADSSAWVNVGSWARARRTDRGARLSPNFDSPDAAQVSFYGQTDVHGQSVATIVRWEYCDSRARPALEAKRKQVSADGRNLVIFDTTANRSLTDWVEEIAQLHGSAFEKIGAVAFFEGVNVFSSPIAHRRRWRIVTNPYALRSIPEELLRALEDLDESQHYGLPRKPRLSMIADVHATDAVEVMRGTCRNPNRCVSSIRGPALRAQIGL